MGEHRPLTDDKQTSVLVLEAGENNDKDKPIRDSLVPLNKGGVVDRKGNVHGVKNLIVADASIIPLTVDGNTSAAAYLIGYTVSRQLKLLDKNIRARKLGRQRYEENEE
ncbi:GMC oxidoreductase [Paenibacillus peoriae]|uniref:GMC oxidoreductase n=1 Tax=Paenibacillus peoriae TaxID=59893 RepID=UPI003D7B070B